MRSSSVWSSIELQSNWGVGVCLMSSLKTIHFALSENKYLYITNKLSQYPQVVIHLLFK